MYCSLKLLPEAEGQAPGACSSPGSSSSPEDAMRTVECLDRHKRGGHQPGSQPSKKKQPASEASIWNGQRQRQPKSKAEGRNWRQEVRVRGMYIGTCIFCSNNMRDPINCNNVDRLPCLQLCNRRL